MVVAAREVLPTLERQAKRYDTNEIMTFSSGFAQGNPSELAATNKERKTGDEAAAPKEVEAPRKRKKKKNTFNGHPQGYRRFLEKFDVPDLIFPLGFGLTPGTGPIPGTEVKELRLLAGAHNKILWLFLGLNWPHFVDRGVVSDLRLWQQVGQVE